MTITEAVYQILDEFYKYECEYDSYGKKEISWIIDNKTEYDFEYYWVNVIAYDKERRIIDKRVVMVDFLPAKEKRRVKHTLPGDTSNICVTIERYAVENLDKSNKEEHINDLYRAAVLNHKEYRDIHEYLFAGADGCIDQKFLCLNVYERKIAAIQYLNSRGVFSDKEVEKIIKCLGKRGKKEEKDKLIEDDCDNIIEHDDEFQDTIDFDEGLQDETDFDEASDLRFYDMEILSINELSVRTRNCLKRANIITLKDLMAYSNLELRKVSLLGKKSYAELLTYVTEKGILLKNPKETTIEDCLFSREVVECFNIIKKRTVGDLIDMNQDDAKRFVKVSRKRRVNYFYDLDEMENIGMNEDILEILRNPGRYVEFD